MKILKTLSLSLLTLVLSLGFVGCAKQNDKEPQIQIPENHWVSEFSSREELETVFTDESIVNEYEDGFEVSMSSLALTINAKVKKVSEVYFGNFDLNYSLGEDEISFNIYLCDGYLYITRTQNETQAKSKMEFVVDESLEDIANRTFNSQEEQMIYSSVSYLFMARTPSKLITQLEDLLIDNNTKSINVTKGYKETKTRYNYSLDYEESGAFIENDLLSVYENSKLIEHRVMSTQIVYYEGSRMEQSNEYVYKTYSGDVELPNFDDFNN